MKIHSRRESGERQSVNISGQFWRLHDQLVALFINELLGWGLPIGGSLGRLRVRRPVSELFDRGPADDEGPPAAHYPALQRNGLFFGELQSILKRADDDQHRVFRFR